MIEEDGHPSIGALRAAVSNRTAALLINNPDDMGIYNPHIAEWVRIVHEAGGLAFCDHASFNGAMGRIRARELGSDAWMDMLHKTFEALKDGGGPERWATTWRAYRRKLAARGAPASAAE